MGKENTRILAQLAFEEKREIAKCFLDFTLRNYKLEYESEPTGLTESQMQPIFDGITSEILSLESMQENSRSDRSLNATLADMLLVLRRGQKEVTCHRLNYCLRQALSQSVFDKLYSLIDLAPEDLYFDGALHGLRDR